MKVKAETTIESAQRHIDIDKCIQQQAQKLKQAEQQLAYEQGKLNALLELIAPPPMTQPTTETAQ